MTRDARPQAMPVRSRVAKIGLAASIAWSAIWLAVWGAFASFGAALYSMFESDGAPGQESWFAVLGSLGLTMTVVCLVAVALNAFAVIAAVRAWRNASGSLTSLIVRLLLAGLFNLVVLWRLV